MAPSLELGEEQRRQGVEAKGLEHEPRSWTQTFSRKGGACACWCLQGRLPLGVRGLQKQDTAGQQPRGRTEALCPPRCRSLCWRGLAGCSWQRRGATCRVRPLSQRAQYKRASVELRHPN